MKPGENNFYGPGDDNYGRNPVLGRDYCPSCLNITKECNCFQKIKFMKDKITESVIEDLKSRSARGIQKYRTTLDQNNNDDFMRHLYEELLDAAQYVKKEMSIIPELQQMIDENPNDMLLGEAIRKKYAKYNV